MKINPSPSNKYVYEANQTSSECSCDSLVPGTIKKYLPVLSKRCHQSQPKRQFLKLLTVKPVKREEVLAGANGKQNLLRVTTRINSPIDKLGDMNIEKLMQNLKNQDDHRKTISFGNFSRGNSANKTRSIKGNYYFQNRIESAEKKSQNGPTMTSTRKTSFQLNFDQLAIRGQETAGSNQLIQMVESVEFVEEVSEINQNNSVQLGLMAKLLNSSSSGISQYFENGERFSLGEHRRQIESHLIEQMSNSTTRNIVKKRII